MDRHHVKGNLGIHTHNAVSINEGLFVRPMSKVGTPEISTPSIFASSLSWVRGGGQLRQRSMA